MLAFFSQWDLVVTPEGVQLGEHNSVMWNFLEKLRARYKGVCGPFNPSAYFFMVHYQSYPIFDNTRLCYEETMGTEFG